MPLIEWHDKSEYKFAAILPHAAYSILIEIQSSEEVSRSGYFVRSDGQSGNGYRRVAAS